MADTHLSELLKSQISLTEWLEKIGHQDAAVLRQEDNAKLGRIDTLHRVIGLPCAVPEVFDGPDVTLDNPRFKQLYTSRKHEMCAFRLAPKKPGLPKLRNRGNTVEAAYAWYTEQAIDPADYEVQIMPHDDSYRWATIFVVNKNGIFGEIIFGSHALLTQGFHGDNAPIVFSYDFKEWHLDPSNDDALTYLKELVGYIHVDDPKKRSQLESELGTTFSNHYINGYFETTDLESAGTWYGDYSITLGKIYEDLYFGKRPTPQEAIVHGQIGCKGQATGKVIVVEPDKLDVHFPKGSVLVCRVTTPDFVPLMQKASAIVTDQGGILSHAAIVARELKVPCIVGTKEATAKLASDQLVLVDADQGAVFDAS